MQPGKPAKTSINPFKYNLTILEEEGKKSVMCFVARERERGRVNIT